MSNQQYIPIYTQQTIPQYQQSIITTTVKQTTSTEPQSLGKKMLDSKSMLMTSVREGTAAYCFSIVAYSVATNGGLDRGYMAIATGFAYAAIAFLFGGVYINPMFSLSALCSRRLRIRTFIVNIISQLIGFILAAVTVRYGFYLDIGLAVPTIGPFPFFAGFIAEFICTYILCMCVVVVGDEEFWRLRPILIGVAYAALSFAVGPITTASFNPFYALGASILSFFNIEAWLFYVAPIVGAISAGIMVWILHLHDIHSNGWIITPKKI